MSKNVLKAVVMAVLIALLAACGSNSKAEPSPENEASGSQASTGEASTGAVGETEWSKSAGLDKLETPEELYEQAKNAAGGKIVVYSTSGRINDVQKTFEAKYPGLKLETFDLKSNVILDKVIREQAAGLFNADMILTKEVGGAIEEELVKKGKLHKYVPQDINDTLFEPWKSSGVAFVPYMEFRAIYYNTEQNDSPPVDNWWELTLPEWKNRVYVADPLQSPAQMDLFVNFVVHADEMAEAYKEQFGEEIQLNGTDNAGYEFIKRFVDNAIIVKSSTDGLDAVGKAPKDKPAPVAIGVSGDIRKVEEKKWKAAFAWDMKPRLSPSDEGLAFIAEKAPNPAGAKLLIRWMAGEADGKGEGTAPFSEEGSWMTRNDVPNPNPKAIDEVNIWPYESDKMYENHEDVVNFWIQISS